MLRAPHSRIRKLTLMLVAVGVGLLLGEAVLRAARPFIKSRMERHIATLLEATVAESRDAYDDSREFFGAHATSPEMQADTRLRFIPKANVQGDGYRTNNVHCRYDDDLRPGRHPDEVRIFITGGSTAWGAGVTQQQLFTTLLEEMFRKRPSGPRVRVICAGVGTYSSQQECGFAEELLAPLEPDVLVMLTGWNDTYFAYRGADEFGNERLSALDAPRYDAYACKLHYLVDRCFYSRQASHGFDRLLADAADPAVAAVERLEQTVHTMHALAGRLNCSLLVCLQPTIYETRKLLTPAERRIAALGEQTYLGFPQYNASAYRILRSALPRDAASNGYTFADADQAIDDIAETVFADHAHLGTRGNRALAEWLFPLLRQYVDAPLSRSGTP